jgi:hypothetical protein
VKYDLVLLNFLFFKYKVFSIWQEYLKLIEDHMEEFQSQEGLTGKQFKKAVEEVGEKHPFLVKMMIASWEFPQFLEMCKVRPTI